MTEIHEFRAMGCKMLAALDFPTEVASRLLSQVPGWFEIWEAILSRFRSTSELSRINDQSGVPVVVSETMWSVLQVARRAEKLSSGLVTPALLSELIIAGYTASFDQLGEERRVRHARISTTPVYSLLDVTFQSEDRIICLPEGLQLDLGGVAKGWAAHRAMRLLKNYGPALVDAGGDIAISGLKSDGRPWLVGIDDPLRRVDSLATLRLGRCGVATSGKDHRRWKVDNRWVHHIIDPRTGEPASTDVLTSTVIASNVMMAEMAAKVVLILGSQAGLAWLNAHPGYAGLIVTDDGDVYTSEFFYKVYGGEYESETIGRR
jgi:thiamine biosynthesis lipoprotein